MPWATTRPCGWSGIARSTAAAPPGAGEGGRRRAGPYRPTASLEMSADEQPHSGRGRRAGHHRPGSLSPRAGRLPGLHRGHRPGGAQGGPRGAARRRGARPDAPGGVRVRGAPRAPPAPRHRGRRRHPAHRAPRGGRPDQGALARRRRLSHQAVLPPGAHPPGGRGASPAPPPPGGAGGRRAGGGGGWIARGAHRVTLSGEEVPLTATEYKLLLTLVERRGRVQTRPQLLETVWDAQPDIQTRTVDMHVQRLRAKLGDVGELIETVRGFGYRFRGGVK